MEKMITFNGVTGEGFDQLTKRGPSAFATMNNGYSEPKYDIQKAQIDDRVIHLEGPVNAALASYITQVLLHLNKLSPQPIQMFINTPGGSVVDGFAIIDTMERIDAPVYTCAKGWAASMGGLLLAAGEKGHRYVQPNSVVLIHEGSNGNSGTSSNFKSYAAFSEKLDARADEWLAERTGKTVDEINDANLVDNWMFAQDAIDFGLADKIFKGTMNEEE